MRLLTEQDYAILFEAVEAWVTKDTAGEMAATLFTSILCSKDDPERAEFEAENERRRAKAKRQEHLRKEQAAILQAKLIQERDSLCAESMVRYRPATIGDQNGQTAKEDEHGS